MSAPAASDPIDEARERLALALCVLLLAAWRKRRSDERPQQGAA